MAEVGHEAEQSKRRLTAGGRAGARAASCRPGRRTQTPQPLSRPPRRALALLLLRPARAGCSHRWRLRLLLPSRAQPAPGPPAPPPTPHHWGRHRARSSLLLRATACCWARGWGRCAACGRSSPRPRRRGRCWARRPAPACWRGPTSPSTAKAGPGATWQSPPRAWTSPTRQARGTASARGAPGGREP